MGHLLRSKEIAAKDIDLHNDSFCLSPLFPLHPDADLLASIREFGLLMPPVLLARDIRYHQVVTGWRRIAAFTYLFPGKSVPCLVAGRGMKDADCLALALEDILLQRSPSPIEKALFLKKMCRNGKPEQIANAYAHRLGLSNATHVISRYPGLLDLENPLVLAIHEKLIDERIALELVELSMRDRLSFYNIVEQLRLSVNNQKKLLVGLRELAARHNSSITEHLGAEEVSQILNHASANVPQKTARLMQWLDRQRNPRSYATEAEFRRQLKNMRLAPNMKVTHAPAFEKDTLTLTVTCADREELDKVLAALAANSTSLEEGR